VAFRGTHSQAGSRWLRVNSANAIVEHYLPGEHEPLTNLSRPNLLFEIVEYP
jgi:hypothetical protein